MNPVVTDILTGAGLFSIGAGIGRFTPPFPWMTKQASLRRLGRYQQGCDVRVPARVHVLDPPESRKPREFWGKHLYRTERLVFEVPAASVARPRDWLEGLLVRVQFALYDYAIVRVSLGDLE
jgi:hypothetical protein